MTMSSVNMSLFSHFVYASFSIGENQETKPNQWVILTVPNIIQIESLKRILRILSGNFIFQE